MTLLASAEGAEILVQHPHTNWRQVLEALQQLDHATRELNTLIGHTPRAVRQPYADAVDVAKAAVEKLFTRSLSIEEAERMYGHLGGSIVRAKAHRGDFNRGDDVDDAREANRRRAEMVRRNLEHFRSGGDE